jgi:GGDEF domain-containing protein
VLDARIVNRVILILSALLGALAGIHEIAPKLVDIGALSSVRTPLWLVLVVVALLMAAIYGLYLSLWIESQNGKNLKDNISRLEQENRIYVRDLQRDIITGIPNQRCLEAELDSLFSKPFSYNSRQLIMIDLDNFRVINNRLNYDVGDKVIRYIAQRMYQNMRRNEFAYKRPMTPELTVEELWRRNLPEIDAISLRKSSEHQSDPIYSFAGLDKEDSQGIFRKYSGGDEFIFIITGTQEDAIGFVRRLGTDFSTKYADDIKKMVGDVWNIGFHAGIYTLPPADLHGGTPHDHTIDGLRNVQRCLGNAKRPEHESNFYCASLE